MQIKLPLLAAAAVVALASPLAAQDPLEAVIDTSDADRFAALFLETEEQPSRERIEANYLSQAGEGLALMQTTRFGTAEALSDAITRSPATYRDAIQRCLPIAKSMEPDLRATYLALSGLFPDETLPRVEVVIGAGTSAGIASPNVQVIGLETLCAASPTEAEFRSALRYFFAHEPVHSLQPPLDETTLGNDPLLTLALHEGVADMIAALVLGRIPDAERDAWAMTRRDALFRQFHADREIIRASVARGETLATFSPEARSALGRWFFNHNRVAKDWRSDLGYWIGRQMALAYVDHAPDKRKAIEELVQGIDPMTVLQASGLSDPNEFGGQ
ncbi:hypothetical protein [Erythrobacter sp. THAF29]|uniref:hypothetical protein n=1 Tax=Erythrobacter sp. THAF29 TaxID=2587851 RepID=UPI0012679190|nr:hypothetical protein [Erythrobacter sp. THAF29]QFT77421.1 hypothetical protein FIU90_07715 [Erythrobacter sp. THAF29]